MTKLEKKKNLAVKTFKIGKNRIIFNAQRLNEIKDAITRQDFRDLLKDGVIKIREIKGTKKKVKRKTRRRTGSIKKKPKRRKKEYVKLTRKLRRYLSELRKQNKIAGEQWINLRKKIRTREFRSKAHLREYILEAGK